MHGSPIEEVDFSHRLLVTRMSGQNDDHSNTPIVHNGIGLTTRGFNLQRQNGVVIFLDVLGIKGIWKKRPAINVVNDWKSVIRSFMDSLENNPPPIRVTI